MPDLVFATECRSTGLCDWSYFPTVDCLSAIELDQEIFLSYLTPDVPCPPPTIQPNCIPATEYETKCSSADSPGEVTMLSALATICQRQIEIDHMAAHGYASAMAITSAPITQPAAFLRYKMAMSKQPLQESRLMPPFLDTYPVYVARHATLHRLVMYIELDVSIGKIWYNAMKKSLRAEGIDAKRSELVDVVFRGKMRISQGEKNYLFAQQLLKPYLKKNQSQKFDSSLGRWSDKYYNQREPTDAAVMREMRLRRRRLGAEQANSHFENSPKLCLRT